VLQLLWRRTCFDFSAVFCFTNMIYRRATSAGIVPSHRSALATPVALKVTFPATAPELMLLPKRFHESWDERDCGSFV
jgi:hypothetical protein